MNIFIQNGGFLFVDGYAQWSSADSGWLFNEKDIIYDLGFDYQENYIEDEDGKLMFPEYDCYIDNFSSDIFHATTKYKNEIFNILFSGEIDKYL